MFQSNVLRQIHMEISTCIHYSYTRKIASKKNSLFLVKAKAFYPRVRSCFRI